MLYVLLGVFILALVISFREADQLIKDVYRKPTQDERTALVSMLISQRFYEEQYIVYMTKTHLVDYIAAFNYLYNLMNNIDTSYIHTENGQQAMYISHGKFHAEVQLDEKKNIRLVPIARKFIKGKVWKV